MRVVVSVKATPGGGQTSQAARYIAYRERDDEREGTRPRPLFSAKENALGFWKAERALTEGRTPLKNELIHIAVSFRAEDFQALSRDESARQRSLREVTREAVSEIAGELRADDLRWVAGIHRNTDNPHIHLLMHRAYLDRETHAERRLTRFPERMLPARVRDENGVEKIHPGGFSQAFESALDRAQERARQSEPSRDEKDRKNIPRIEEKLLEAARQNPSIAGRELTQEIILRGPARELNEPLEMSDLRVAFRTPSIDDPDYHSQPEQADWLGQRSQELRDLYERGAVVLGDTLIFPAEEHELPAGDDRPFITTRAYAYEQIRNPVQADEFHALARAIAGQTADSQTEIEVFRHYYAQIRTEKIDPTLNEMRPLAAEMAQLETRESVDFPHLRMASEDGDEAAENEIERDGNRVEIARETVSGGVVGGRGSEAAAVRFNTAARKVRLVDESLRFPAGLSTDMSLLLASRTLPALDRQIENGRPRVEILTSIDEAIYHPEMDENEREERARIGGFLKDYVAERLNDPETRALNASATFRHVHKEITDARTPEELNSVAEKFLRENLERGNALRQYRADPERYPQQPEIMPLNHRERNLLFFGRAAEHHSAEMRELRYAWGLSRKEREERVKSLREGQSPPSMTLETMVAELDSRRTLPALRHYQAAILNEHMHNPGRLDLHQMYARLPPHERTFLVERIDEKKDRITLSRSPARDVRENGVLSSGVRPVGSIPRESDSYREYLASMGKTESQLLNDAVRERQGRTGHAAIEKEDQPLSITEARAILPREEQVRIREQARRLAWEHITPPEVFAAEPESPGKRFEEVVAHLQDDTQPRTRLAHTILEEQTRENAGADDRNGPDALSKLGPADAHRLKALEDYAARMREELYRGFESLDALRRELEHPRDLNAAERAPSIDSAANRDLVYDSVPGDSRLVDGRLSAPERN